MSRFLKFALLTFCFAGGMAQAAASAPKAPPPVVLASISPLQSLLANVMAGVGEPLLLMRPGSSPHDYVMRPSEAAMLARADVIFWLGEAGERVLAKPIAALKPAPHRRVVALLDEHFPEILPLRAPGLWLQGGITSTAGEENTLPDPHIWVDPVIAAEIVKVMVRELSRADPQNSAIYQKNGQKTLARLKSLDSSLRTRLQPLAHTPFMVFHDAFQYFERRYNLDDVGAVALSPDVQPGARRVAELKAAIEQKGVKCIFAEPQFSPALMHILLQGSPARAGTADPLGAHLTPGPEAYFQLMDGLANSLASCLEER